MKELWKNSIIEGTIKTLRTQCSLECILSFEKNFDVKNLSVASFIEFSSGEFEGSIKILFPEGTFLGIVSHMFGGPIKNIDEELVEAASELLNIIYGYGKKCLSEKGVELPMEFPIGSEDFSLNESSTEKLKFETPEGEFLVELMIRDRMRNVS